jgi:7-carboxy-7-deazaguanine synthase
MLTVCEIFASIQGESTYVGLPCTFVRLSGCNLRCSYCDTAYAWEGGTPQSIEQIMTTVQSKGVSVVEITGGEPLVQAETPALCARLIDAGHRVLVETNGSCDIAALPPECVRIVDVKTPGSGAGGSFRAENLDALTSHDEVKMVLSDRADFDWAVQFVQANRIAARCEVIFSAAQGWLTARELAEWIVTEHAPVRLGVQLHRIIWGEEQGR